MRVKTKNIVPCVTKVAQGTMLGGFTELFLQGGRGGSVYREVIGSVVVVLYDDESGGVEGHFSSVG